MGDESRTNAEGKAAEGEGEELKGQEPLPTADNEDGGAAEVRESEFVSLCLPKRPNTDNSCIF